MSIAREILMQEDTETRGHIEPMHKELARRTVKWYVCARCWGDLTMEEAPGGVIVECVHCKKETCGYVTRYWTERKRSADHFEAVEVTRMLRRIGVLPPKEKLSVEANLKELGF